ncbi:MAG: imidazoleglycerol-phosphate dehydratase HisB [Candidatus Tritonobacter lacicola]|nr:imidazoleglycerol-phosphate dehydratase HisB [Candidatus Tritonobacter lacicola]
MMKRAGIVHRKTKETDIRVNLDLDGGGRASVDTGIGFLDHMLELFACHGLFDLEVKASGDRHVDDHHIVEDLGLCLGESLLKALGKKKGIRRYGFAIVPMDEALAMACLDISGRPGLVFNVKTRRRKIKDFDLALFEDFFKAISNTARMTVHIRREAGDDPHHVYESVFKAFGRALDAATAIDERVKGVPSTKGII